MANTPNDLTDAEINDLVENERMPMSAEGKRLFDLGKTMLGLLVPETFFKVAPEPRSTLVFEPIPYGRGWGWACFNSNLYDGPESAIGSGATKEEALTDYEEQIESERVRAAVQNRKAFTPIDTGCNAEPTDGKPGIDNYHDIEEPQ